MNIFRITFDLVHFGLVQFANNVLSLKAIFDKSLLIIKVFDKLLFLR